MKKRQPAVIQLPYTSSVRTYASWRKLADRTKFDNCAIQTILPEKIYPTNDLCSEDSVKIERGEEIEFGLHTNKLS